MQGPRVLLASILIVGALAGCVSAPRHVVDFSSVSDHQPGGDFKLVVRVTGLTQNGTVPVSGAFVGVVTGTTAIAKDRTDAEGYATLTLRDQQTIHVVAKAPTWTTEQSSAVRIGQSSSVACTGEVCDLTAGDDAKEFGLEQGGTVGLVLFPTRVQYGQAIKLEPRAVVGGNAVPPGEKWHRVKSVVNPDEELASLQMLRFDQATVRMTWTNQLIEQADVELAVGCSKGAPQKKTSANLPRVDQGQRALTVEYDENHSGYWSECKDLFGGPYLDNVNTQVQFVVTMDMRFLGRSTIVPVE